MTINFVSFFGMFFIFKYDNILKSKSTIGAIVAVGAVLIFSLYTYNRTFSVAEGWYTAYAQLIINGKKPYIDFELLFTPLYAWIIALLVLFFGTNFLVLRIFGLFLFLLSAYYIYRLFELIFGSFPAAIFAIVSIFVMQSEVVQINYDYIIVFNLFNYIGIYYFVKGIKNYLEDKKYNVFFLISGLFLMNSLLVRQATGILTCIFGVCVIIYLAIVNRKTNILKALLFYIIGMAIPLFLTVFILLINGQLLPFIDSTLIKASSSKGGVEKVLFGWIPRVLTLKGFIRASIFVLLVTYLLLFSQKKDSNNKALIFYLTVTIFIIMFLLCITNEKVRAFFLQYNTFDYVNDSVMIVLAIFICFAFLIIGKLILKKKIDNYEFIIMAISGFILFTNLGCAFSASVSQGQAALNYGFILGFIYFIFKKYLLESFIEICVYSYSIIIIFSCFSRKLNCAYVWWGLNQGSYMSQTVEIEDVPELKGIYTNEYNAENISKIVTTIKADDEINSLYCFPHIPVFYTLTGILPSNKAVAAWFDIASDEAVLEDLKYIEGNLPDCMIVAYCGEYTMISHEHLFRENDEKSGQRKIYEYIDSLISSGIYDVILEKDLNYGVGDSYPIKVIKINDSFKKKYETLNDELKRVFLDYRMSQNNTIAGFYGEYDNDFIFDGDIFNVEEERLIESYKDAFDLIKSFNSNIIFMKKDLYDNLDYHLTQLLCSTMVEKTISFNGYKMIVLDDKFNYLSQETSSIQYDDGWITKNYSKSFFIPENYDNVLIKFFIPVESWANITININGIDVAIDLPSNKGGYHEVCLDAYPNEYNYLRIITKNELRDYRDLGVILVGVVPC